MPEPITSAATAKLLISPTIVAGMMGAIVSLRFASHLNWKERVTAVISGAIMSFYIAPWACHYFNLQQFEGTVGFMIGLFGLSLTAAVYEAIKKADPWGLIMARFGAKQ